MAEPLNDELWPHFAPFWSDLREIAPGILLAGGYALFLKQVWLSTRRDFPTLVAVEQWRDQIPRVTKDLDLIAELNLIASPDEQKALHEVLAKHAFQVVEANARWQFQKPLDRDKSVVVDFHAPRPIEDRSDLRLQGRRVKPQPSLNKTGIHGRANPEAVGCEQLPFIFTFNSLEIVIPNPVTLAIMKLAAMRDRWSVTQDADKAPEIRQREEGQARKHAQDVCRVLAMMTRDEDAMAGRVLDAIRDTDVFGKTAGIRAEFFHDGGWGTQAVEEFWLPEDLRLILTTLERWFHLI